MSKQSDLFGDVPIIRRGDSIVPPVLGEQTAPTERFELHSVDVPRARADDPATSQIAAARVIEFDSVIFERIDAAMKTAPPLITHEIAQLCGLREDQVHKRLPELEKLGVVHVVLDPVTGKARTRKGPSGRPCRLWSWGAA